MIHLIQNDGIEVVKEALWAISNATVNAKGQQFIQIVEKGVFAALAFVVPRLDPQSQMVALEAINNILAFGAENEVTDLEQNLFCI